MLVLKHAIQNKELLAARMDMGGEMAAWHIAHDRGGTGHFIAQTVQHAAVDAGHGSGMHRSAAVKIGVQFHGLFLLALEIAFGP